MSSLNKAMLIGYLGRDPELKYTQSGLVVCTLNVATDEGYIDNHGNKVERTEWHRVQVWQKTAENCAQYLRKGSLVFVEGSLTTRKWQDQQGQDRYTTEIKALRVQFLDRKGDRNDSGGQQNSRPPQQRQPPSQSSRDDYDDNPTFPSEGTDMDDIPF